jgi:membrane associated rhomboid family serine protease
MAPLSSIFLSSVFLSFGVTLAVAGLFGAYFGKGRSRAVGFLLAILALILLGLFCALTWDVVPGLDPVFSPDIVAEGLVAVFAALLGAVVAGFFFVAAVMKS